jgi:hypothetical protein
MAEVKIIPVQKPGDIHARYTVLKAPSTPRPMACFTCNEPDSLSDAERQIKRGTYRWMAFQTIAFYPVPEHQFDIITKNLLADYEFIQRQNEHPAANLRPGYWSDTPPEGNRADLFEYQWTEDERRRFIAGNYLKVIMITDGKRVLLADPSGYTNIHNVGLFKPKLDQATVKNLSQLWTVLREDNTPMFSSTKEQDAQDFRLGYNGCWIHENHRTDAYNWGIAHRVNQGDAYLVKKYGGQD